jgi:hypothetical protein
MMEQIFTATAVHVAGDYSSNNIRLHYMTLGAQTPPNVGAQLLRSSPIVEFPLRDATI